MTTPKYQSPADVRRAQIRSATADFRQQVRRRRRKTRTAGCAAILGVAMGVLLVGGWFIMLGLGILHSVFIGVPAIGFGEALLVMIAVALLRAAIFPSRSSS